VVAEKVLGLGALLQVLALPVAGVGVLQLQAAAVARAALVKPQRAARKT
jgi:hypothetical protein